MIRFIPGAFLCSHIMAAMVLLSGCSNSLDLRSQKDATEERVLEQANMQSAQTDALSVSESASAARYINNQDILHPVATSGSTATGQVQPLPSAALIERFAGRYRGQIPCHLQSALCSSDKLDMTLTLLPDGSAIRTLAEQGKVPAMLEKETASWTVSANGQNIILVLPSHEIWSFQRIGRNQLRFQPNASALIEPAEMPGQYSLLASNN